MGLLIRVFICIVGVSLWLYTAIDRQNRLTELRMEIPPLAKEVKKIREENNRIVYEIERFESPIHLMELARKPEFGHLKYPYQCDVIVIETEQDTQ